MQAPSVSASREISYPDLSPEAHEIIERNARAVGGVMNEGTKVGEALLIAPMLVLVPGVFDPSFHTFMFSGIAQPIQGKILFKGMENSNNPANFQIVEIAPIEDRDPAILWGNYLSDIRIYSFVQMSYDSTRHRTQIERDCRNRRTGGFFRMNLEEKGVCSMYQGGIYLFKANGFPEISHKDLFLCLNEAKPYNKQSVLFIQSQLDSVDPARYASNSDLSSLLTQKPPVLSLQQIAARAFFDGSLREESLQNVEQNGIAKTHQDLLMEALKKFSGKIPEACIRQVVLLFKQIEESKLGAELGHLPLRGIVDLTKTRVGVKEIRECWCQFTDREISTIAQNWSELSVLQLKLAESFNAPRISDRGVKQLGVHCKNLTFLGLNYCNSISDLSLRIVVRNCRALRKIELEGCEKVLGVFVRNVPDLQIEKLNLGNCLFLRDRGAISVARFCPKLRKLNLEGTSVTNRGLIEIGKRCLPLEKLTIPNDWNYISEKGPLAVVNGCEDLKDLDYEDNEGPWSLNELLQKLGWPPLPPRTVRSASPLPRPSQGRLNFLEDLSD